VESKRLCVKAMDGGLEGGRERGMNGREGGREE
jgi:hypothetical protein